METTEDINRVYEVFKDFFGEQYVDLQEEEGTSSHTKFILVYWPKVRVTNEYGKYIDITDLYAKIPINNDGRIPWESRGFYLNRTSYTAVQFYRSYMHSHAPSIPKNNLRSFTYVCLGSGPLNGTIATLKNDSDSLNWMLFCQELSLYVTVESIRGVPYIRLETVVLADTNDVLRGYESSLSHYALVSKSNFFDRFLYQNAMKDFYLWYLDNGHLKINYKNGKYVQGMRYYDYMLDISNAFIQWYNEHKKTDSYSWLFDKGILYKVKAIDGKFCRESNTRLEDSYRNFIGRYVLTFKGEEKHLVITDVPSARPSEDTLILNPDVALQMLKIILININLRYERKREEDSSTANSDKKRFYI